MELIVQRVHSCLCVDMFTSDNVPSLEELSNWGKGFLSHSRFSLHLILSPDQRGSPPSDLHQVEVFEEDS